MENNFDWITDFGPCIHVDGDKVEVLKEPREFYAAISERCRSAKRRVVLASLYLGTGDLERGLVDALKAGLQSSVSEGDGNLQVNILLDACRGSRGSPNSCSLLTPLLDANSGDRRKTCVKVALYRSPHLSGFWRATLPERWNEIVGLQHVKVYLFDDDVLMTGANLSSDYFTNRQDRYILFRGAKDLADFCEEFVGTITRFSHRLESDSELSPPEIDPREVAKARAKVENLIGKWRSRPVKLPLKDTKVWPLVQMGQLGVEYDKQATAALLSYEGANEVKLATGYFNLTDEYKECVLGNEKTTFDVLMAHPRANGFFNATGMSGGVTPAYTLLAHQFFDRITAVGASARVRLYEYLRPSWTFHAKGLWLYTSPSSEAIGPALTLIGSPNFGYRSVHRDLELQLALVTTNHRLRSQLHQEQIAVFAHSTAVTAEVFAAPDRYVPYWVRLIIRTMKHFF